MRMKRDALIVLAAIAAAVGFLAIDLNAAQPGEWPQCRGPKSDGISTETGLLREWPKGGPPLLWKAKGIGSGYASVTIAGGRIFTMGDIGVGCNCLRIIQNDGKFAARQVYANKEMLNHHGGVLLVEDFLYGCSENGGLRCLELSTGKLLWRQPRPGNGAGGSLVCADGMLIHRDEFGGVALVKASPEGYELISHFQSDGP
jgi:hypothetical protein